jgi:carbonic anhydrase
MAIGATGGGWRLPPPHISFTIALGVFVLVSIVLYASVDSNDRDRRRMAEQKDTGVMSRLKDELDELKKQVDLNDKYMEDLDQKLDVGKKHIDDAAAKANVAKQSENVIPPPQAPPQNEHLKEVDLEAHGGKLNVVHKVLHEKTSPASSFVQSAIGGQFVCPASEAALPHSAKSDVQMLNAYDAIPFDNPDGGVWKQGWELTYDKEKIKQEKTLEVIVIPHSHCDPGWLQTFEGYFEQQTRHILDGMVKHLTEKPDMKFIYAEMSFFELWWSTQTDEVREKVAKLIEKGQLEIVTGAWVMTDEANAHYYATVMETFEGHEFLQNQLAYAPRNHWSIDPFGISPTLAQVMKSANLSNLAIQRVHYSVKKHLAQKKQLEFLWRQLFAGASDRTDIPTHMFPFYSYDVPHTCGPDPSVCCQFDFRRLGNMGCPWGKQPQRIIEKCGTKSLTDRRPVPKESSVVRDEHSFDSVGRRLPL